MIAQASRENKMARRSYVPLSAPNRTRAVHDGNDVNYPERTLAQDPWSYTSVITQQQNVARQSIGII